MYRKSKQIVKKPSNRLHAPLNCDPASAPLLFEQSRLQQKITSLPYFFPAAATFLQQQCGLPRYLDVLHLCLNRDIVTEPLLAIKMMLDSLRRQGMEVEAQYCVPQPVTFNFSAAYKKYFAAWIRVAHAELHLYSKIIILHRGYGDYSQAAGECLRQVSLTHLSHLQWQHCFDTIWIANQILLGSLPSNEYLTTRGAGNWPFKLSYRMRKANLSRLQRKARVFTPPAGDHIVAQMTPVRVARLMESLRAIIYSHWDKK